MAYPAAYRKGAGAFEPLSPGKYTRPNTKPGPLPVPDNDNEPPPPKSGVPRGVGRTALFKRMLRRHLLGLAFDVTEEVFHQYWTDRRQWNLNGWRLRFGPCTPPASYPTDVGLLSYTANLCLGGQALDEKYKPRDYSIGIIGASRGAVRYYTYIGFDRTSAHRYATPKLLPTRKLFEENVFAPVPEELPWLKPVPEVNPLSLPKLPWPLVALRPDTPWHQRGYAAPADAELLPSRAPAVGVPLWPRGQPLPIPVAPPGAPLKPPGPKVKEKKARAGYGAAKAVVGAVTEGVDVVEALWDALPRNRQTRQKGKKTTRNRRLLISIEGGRILTSLRPSRTSSSTS